MREDTSPRVSRRALLAYAAACGAAAAAARPAVAALLSGPQAGDSVMIERFGPDGRSLGTVTLPRVVKTDAEWRRQLSLLAYAVTQHAGTEPAFSGAYDHNHADGLYSCVCCATVLFDSRTKFDSGTGWPSFWKPVSRYNVVENGDGSFGLPCRASAVRRTSAMSSTTALGRPGCATA